MDITSAIFDPELGMSSFTVTRPVYTRMPSGVTEQETVTTAMGTIHPAPPETLELLPEEERHETHIVIHTDFALSLGEDSGKRYTGPDRIGWNGHIWRVVQVRDWSMFGYYRAIAVMLHE